MRFALIIALLVLIFFPITIFGQNREMSLEKLKPPTMPSAMIIGSQVNEISRPKSLNALEVALLSNFLDSTQNLVIPNDFALEFNPYLLGDRKDFDYEEYLNNDPKKNFFKNLTISLASTTSYIINDTLASNALGFGLRTRILNGTVNDSLRTAYETIINENKYSDRIKRAIKGQINRIIKDDTLTIPEIIKKVHDAFKVDALLSGDNDPETELAKFYYQLAEDYMEEIFNQLPEGTEPDDLEDWFEYYYDKNISERVLSRFRELISRVQSTRNGLIWEINYAQALNFPANDFDRAITSRWGFWTNLSYKPRKSGKNINWTKFEGILMIRYIKNNKDFIKEFNPTILDDNLGNNLDVGLRLVYESNRFTFELEYLKRFNRSKEIMIINGNEFSRTIRNETKKYLLNVNYAISDNMVLSYNIGRGYDLPNVTNNNLISGLTLNFGIGDVKITDLINKDQN